MAAKLKNNAVSKFAAGLATNGTAVTVMPGEGAKFPAPTGTDWFPLYLIKADGTFEICKATARAGDVITVVRAQEGTAALTFVAGERVELRYTAAAYDDRVSQDQFAAFKASLVGIIAEWGGAIGSIPTGWALCDGTNGTPDLRDKFLVGAGRAYNVGVTGGADTVTLTTAQIPSHNHGVSDPGHAHGVYDPGHGHGIYDPGHVHNAPGNVSFMVNSAGPGNYSGGGSQFAVVGNTAVGYTGIGINAAGSNISIYGSYTGIGIQYTGGGAAHENRPPYYALAYIQYKG
jgi:microcystin-dependent protein